MLQRALGDEGFAQFQQERGVAEEYSLTPVQADAILRMTLGQLVNLEQEKLVDEHAELLERDRRVPAASSPTRRNIYGDHPRGLRGAEQASTATTAAPRSAAKRSARSISRT